MASLALLRSNEGLSFRQCDLEHKVYAVLNPGANENSPEFHPLGADWSMVYIITFMGPLKHARPNYAHYGVEKVGWVYHVQDHLAVPDDHNALQAVILVVFCCREKFEPRPELFYFWKAHMLSAVCTQHMSTRLQVLLPKEELEGIRQAATSENLTVGEWVRRSLRAARQNKPNGDAATKLTLLRHAARLAYPTNDINQMLGEIEHGRQ